MTLLRSTFLAALFLAASTANTHAHCAQKVWMITQTACRYCDQARAFFIRNGVPFTEYNVDDRRVRQWTIGNLSTGTVRAFAQNRYGWVTTPIIEVDNAVIRGFLPESLQKKTCSYN